jgi:hypothetical protein
MMVIYGLVRGTIRYVQDEQRKRDAPGDFVVTRFCCVAGTCGVCRAVATRQPRKRVVEARNLNEQAAPTRARQGAKS